MTNPTPREFFEDTINRWEDEDGKVIYSGDAADPGNWQGGQRGAGELVGSQHGVTAQALAVHRHMSPYNVTEEDIRSITLEEAADIAMDQFFARPHLDKLTWCPATAMWCDHGFNAGPGSAVRNLQHLCGAQIDGQIGPQTIQKWNDWVAANSWDVTTDATLAQREASYRSFGNFDTYGTGWLARARWYSRQNKEWYGQWNPEDKGLLDKLIDFVRP